MLKNKAFLWTSYLAIPREEEFCYHNKTLICQVTVEMLTELIFKSYQLPNKTQSTGTFRQPPEIVAM